MRISGPNKLHQVLLGHELALGTGKGAALAAFLHDRTHDQSCARGSSLCLCHVRLSWVETGGSKTDWGIKIVTQAVQGETIHPLLTHKGKPSLA